MTDLNRYAYWHTMLAQSGIYVDPEHTGTIDGYWRLIGARTKADYPVAAWMDGQSTAEMLKVGRKAEFNLQSAEGQDFMAGSWPKCMACTEEDYNRAIETGFWPDGKPSRITSDAEKLGVDLGEGATGGNAPPSYELLSQQLDELVAKARALVVKDQETADAAKVLADRIKLVWDKADKERDTEKRPHDEASKAVQAKWMAHMSPADLERKALLSRMDTWLTQEQRRRDELARQETERRREAARQEYAADIEALSDGEFADKYGHEKPQPEGGDEVTAPVAFEPEIAPVQAEKVTAGGAFTRNASAKKKKVARIVDMDALYQSLKDNDEFVAFMQKKADAAMRAKITLPGVKIEEE